MATRKHTNQQWRELGLPCVGDEVLCGICGKPFILTHTKRKYCSPECSETARLARCKEHRERQKQGEPLRKKKWAPNAEMRTCHQCGKPSVNYWCDACWKKRARTYGFNVEDVPLRRVRALG